MIRADPKDCIIRHTVKSIQFGLYTDADVRSRSVLEITSPQTFLESTPLPGGLYDPRLGPRDAQDRMPCPTCACRFLACPGHFGHVELCVPVYQPLLFKELLTVLQSKCLSCHRLRVSKAVLLRDYTKLLLMELGDFETLDRLEDTVAVLAAQQDKDKGANTNINTTMTARKGQGQGKGQGKDQDKMASNQVLEDVCHAVLDRYAHIQQLPGITSVYQRSMLLQYRKAIVKTWKAMGKCTHCGQTSPKIKHVEFNKIFHLALTQKQAAANRHESESGEMTKSALVTLQERKDNKGKTGTEDGYDSDDTHDMEPPLTEQDVQALQLEDNQGLPTTSLTEQDLDGMPKTQTKTKTGAPSPSRDQYYMPPSEVMAQCQLTWEHHGPLLTLALFGTLERPATSYTHFFSKAIPVPPSRFRPPMVLGTMLVEHSQNARLSKILSTNAALRDQYFVVRNERSAHSLWIQLQTEWNCLVDSTKDPSTAAKYNNTPPGLRQLLEKKEGIFRKHMMGKRVDSACRSVISPDPYVGTNEIGIPLAFAQVLIYPTPVTEWNMTELRRLVERGPHNYPGARWVEFADSNNKGERRRIELAKMSDDHRRAIGAMLGNALRRGHGSKPVIVGRQLRHGDYMLVNRQPTLHKPGIMAHQVRILHNPTQKTIRMHYANCNTYNADFDGDEMNCHFPQSDVARAEAIYIASTDLQYIVPTDGTPLRGLIQDHVCGGVKLTARDTFLKRWEYQQLLFAALASLPRLEVLEDYQDIQMVPPAILKPEPLWTGKQVITTLLLHLCNSPRGKKQRAGDNPSMTRDGTGSAMLRQGGLSLERKSKTPASAFAGNEEHLVLIRDGELLRGVLDKSAFGATDFCMVHGVYEAYGPQKAGLLLNALGRLFTSYIQYYAGHSCRVEDLVLTKESDEARRKLVQRAFNVGSRACKAWADSDGGKVPIEPVAEREDANQPLKPVEVATASAKIGQLLGGPQGAENFAALDGYMMSQLNPLASEIVAECLPSGLAVPFPANTFSLMTMTGAKGSMVNQSQVSCALGQQALEGRRVPRMNSGKTLPSFAPYDLNPRADGFVMDRFLTGVRPQEYYFHCMAGREGLVDTAVKTSRSGYLQRCLVKHLEELKVCYDYTVRNGEGGVVQFLYGEDGLDPTKASFLDCTTRSFEFMARNHKPFQLQNSPLPGSSIDVAAADFDQHESMTKAKYDEEIPIQKGDLLLARRLKSGSTWIRGSLCIGWHDARVIGTHEDGKYLDLEYVKDGHQIKRVPRLLDYGRDACGATSQRAFSSKCELVKPASAEPIISTPKRRDGKTYHIGSSGACVSERVASAAKKAIATETLEVALKSCKISADKVGQLVAAKYGSALCAPGEAVGSIAAQSVGEPSTQMTLNTFHLAGAGANVTLGIPRLREIIMTASRQMKTPTMSAPLHESVTEEDATKLTRSFTKLTLLELLAGHQGVTVHETLMIGESGHWERAYFIVLKLHPAERISTAFGLSLSDIARVVGQKFGPYLKAKMRDEIRRTATDGDITSNVVRGGEATSMVAASGSDGNDGTEAKDDGTEKKGRQDRKEDNDDLSDNEMDTDDEDGGGEEDGVAAVKYNRSENRDASYGFGADDSEDDGAQDADSDDEQQQSRRAPATASDDSNATSPAIEYSLGDSRVKLDRNANSITLPPLTVDPSARPLLMVGLVEMAAEKTLIRSRKNIDAAYVNKEEGRGRCLQTAGINFEEFWSLPDNVIDHHRLLSNDTWAIRCAYGVEAARCNIVDQIRSVFGVYGIEVDPRHLSLIADYMTFEGGYKAMNRIGMEEMSSTLLQMSFETTAHFLTRAALIGTKDNLESPSANIVVGKPIRHGTGAFDLLAKTTTY